MWCCILAKIFWNEMKKKSNIKKKQTGDFTHCYCCYGIITTNESKGKQKFVSIVSVTS